MNLVDCYVTEIINRKEVELDGEPWVSYRVKAVAWGREHICTLAYPINEEPDIKVGFKFQA